MNWYQFPAKSAIQERMAMGHSFGEDSTYDTKHCWFSFSYENDRIVVEDELYDDLGGDK